MTDRTTGERARAEDEITAMLRDGRMDGLVRFLERKFGECGTVAEDAVVDSVIAALKTAERRPIDNMTAFLATVAKRRTIRLLKNEGRYVSDEDAEDVGASWQEFELVQTVSIVAKL